MPEEVFWLAFVALTVVRAAGDDSELHHENGGHHARCRAKKKGPSKSCGRKARRCVIALRCWRVFSMTSNQAGDARPDLSANKTAH